MARIRSSLLLPVLIGVAGIVSTIVILVGWSFFFTRYYTLWTRTYRIPDLGMSYWVSLVLGCMFLVGIVGALVMLLIGNIRQTLYLRQQDTFIDGVTHEFKSPLASIRLCLETMEMRELAPDMQTRFVGMMKKDVERLIAFVEHILEAGRLEHDQYELRYELTSIPELVYRCRSLICSRYQLPEDCCECTFLLAPEAEYLLIDPIALETILMNLLTNAVKYSHEPPVLNVIVEQKPGALVFEVRDRGIGIPKRLLKKVFQRFYRVRIEGRVNARGTGLGLYVVSSLVKRLGGVITADSEGEGRGSVFRVILPNQTAVSQVSASSGGVSSTQKELA